MFFASLRYIGIPGSCPGRHHVVSYRNPGMMKVLISGRYCILILCGITAKRPLASSDDFMSHAPAGDPACDPQIGVLYPL